MTNLRGEVIAIGDELTTGQRLDTNSRWLSERLTALGVGVRFHATVVDDLEAQAEAFRLAAGRADVALVTGGLGPTADDLTRDALALAAGAPLIEDPESLAAIEARFCSRDREMPPQNRRQALFPEGACPIPNPGGTAPGVDCTIGACRLFALPGVPAEMRPMFDATVAPAIATMAPQSLVTRHHLVRCFGVGESSLEAMLPDLIARGREPLVGITASRATITLRVTATGRDADACDLSMGPTLDQVRKTLGELVFAECRPGEPEVELHHTVVDWLASLGRGVVSVESMTGGLLGQRLAEADAGRGAVRAAEYRPAAPLPTDEALEAVAALAAGLVERGAADHALVVGPPPPTPDGKVAVAAAGPGGVERLAVRPVGHPSIHHDLVAKHAMNLLRLSLLREEDPGPNG